MTIQAEAMKLKGELIFKVQTELEKLFFDFPLSIDLLKSMGIALLLQFADQLKDEILSRFDVPFDLDNMNQLKNAIKKNPKTNAIFKAANQLMDEEALSNALLACEKAKAEKDPTALFNETNTHLLTENKEDINKFIASIKVQNNNSLLDKLDVIKDKLNGLMDDASDVLNIMNDYLAYALLGYYIVNLIIDLFTRTDMPSGYLSRYTGKLVSVFIASVSDAAQELYDMVSSILNIVISVDALLTGLIVAMTLYVLNRLKFQESSKKELSKMMCPDYDGSLDGFDEDPSLNERASIDLSNITDLPDVCDYDEFPEYLVPKEPFELKLANSEINCSVDFVEEDDIISLQDAKPLLATKAVVENQRDGQLKILVEKGNKIKTGKLIGLVGKKKIYSPINGTVYDITNNQIFFDDITDKSQSFLEEKAKDLSDKYSEFNASKEFLKKWAVKSLYPVMLGNSPTNDREIAGEELTAITNVGVEQYYNKLVEDYNKKVEIYEKNAEIIASKDNVTIHAEDETLHIIKRDIDNLQVLLGRDIKKLQKDSIEIANVTMGLISEYALIDFYFEFLLELAASDNKTSIETKFYDNLHKFQERRLYIEQFDTTVLNQRVDDLTLELLGDFYPEDLDLKERALKSYNTTNELKEIKDWLTLVAKNNESIEEIDKVKIINKIIFLLEFIVQVPEYAEKYGDLDPSKVFEQTVIEGNYINRYINSIFRKIINIPKQIKSLEAQIDDISLISSFSIIEYNDANHRQYVITPDEDVIKCVPVDLDPNAGGNTTTDFSDINYWIKYFSIATLTGCGMPGIGWATGLILPSGPVLLPVVYIPIKAVAMDYGFVVFGLTITGVVLMPFMMFVNLSTVFQLPLFDPVKALKNEISALKLNLVGQLDEFKVATIKQFLDSAKVELDAATVAYEGAKDNHIQHKLKKPPKTKKYIKEQAEWTVTNVEYIQSKLTFGVAKFSAETKYSLLYILWSVGGELSEKLSAGLGQAFAALKQAEDLINIQFDALAKMVETLEKIVGPLPITLQPDSANWGFTLKNPMPLTPFGLQLTAPMIQLNILDPIIEKFRAKNVDFMSPGGVKLDYASYIELIQSMLSILILRDPFPPYEKLSLTNVAWIIFLTGELIPFGARQFGMPGMP